jgi:hypothetical protein
MVTSGDNVYEVTRVCRFHGQEEVEFSPSLYSSGRYRAALQYLLSLPQRRGGVWFKHTGGLERVVSKYGKRQKEK